MKIFSAALISALALISSCSTPLERHQERQEEARANYDQNLKESQQRYDQDEMKVQKDEAKKMIDRSDSVNVDPAQGSIKVNN